MDKVTRIELTLNESGGWDVAVINEIASERGGGSQVRSGRAGKEIREALDVAHRLALDIELGNIVAQMRASWDEGVKRGSILPNYPLKKSKRARER